MQPTTQRNIRLLIAVCVMLTSGLVVLVWAIRLEPRAASLAQQSDYPAGESFALTKNRNTPTDAVRADDAWAGDAVAAMPPAAPAAIRIPAALLRVDVDGNLQVDTVTAQALAFLHAMLLQADDRHALSRLVNQLRQVPGGEAGHQAAALLVHYHEYQKRIADVSVVTAVPASPEALEALRQDQARLRAAYFSPGDVKALFSDDISARPEQPQDSASDESALALKQELDYLRRQGASREDRHYARVLQVGEEAAVQLTESEDIQQDWRQRYARYDQDRRSLQSDGLSADDQRALDDAVMQNYFSPEEFAAVKGYERRLAGRSGDDQ